MMKRGRGDQEHADGAAVSVAKIELFCGITQLIIKGGGVVTIASDGLLEGVTKADKTGPSELTLAGTGRNGNGSTISMSNGDVFMNIGGGGGGTMFLNGVRFDLDKLAALTADEEDEQTEKVVYRLDPASCRINTVAIQGSASFHIPPQLVDDRAFNASVPGSGDITIPPTPNGYQAINISISGSGDVKGANGTTTEFITVNISGSGDVAGLHVNQSGSVNVCGSGDVKLSASHPDRIASNKTGSGSIQIQ
jgi:hypothetical protein